MTVMRSVVLGYGAYLPERILTNAELATMVDTSDEWIVQRTGIQQRHMAAEGSLRLTSGLKAAQAAIAKAGIDTQSIDLIVVATSTPDNTFPATAVAIQNGLGIHPWRGLRPSGRLYGIYFRAGDRRQLSQDRRLQARAGDRRRNLLAHSGLERSRHLCAVRRRCRRCGSRGSAAGGNLSRSRHPDDSSALRWPPQG